MGPALTPNELSRYSRHIMLPEIGVEGQLALKKAKILVVGIGGLGSPLSFYLTAAGVGTIGLIDNDTVDERNLQRQILFTIEDIGLPKVDCAATHLQQLNPQVSIETYNTVLSSRNALEIIERYDLVIDGTDNFPTRYLVNDACILLNKPNIYGSIYRFEGQATVFNYQKGPCYRCLYPEPPPPGMMPSCAEGGVFGVLPGVIASIQATEAIKIITQLGGTLDGRLLLYDALHLEFEELQIFKDKQCPICGTKPSINTLVDYQQFCGLNESSQSVTTREVTPMELEAQMESGATLTLIDIREPFERAICEIPYSIHIPMQVIDKQIHEFDSDQRLVLYCKTGARSKKLCLQLMDQGFNQVANLKGGIMAWAQDVDKSIIRY